MDQLIAKFTQFRDSYAKETESAEAFGQSSGEDNNGPKQNDKVKDKKAKM